MGVLKANAKERQLQEYVYDLLWMIVRTKYDNLSSPMPSELGKPAKRDMRTAREIKDYLLKKLTA